MPKKGYKQTEEHKEKCAKLRIGTKRSEETKEKMRKKSTGNKSNLGRKFSDEHKANLSKSLTGHKMSEEQKKKLSKVKTGKLNPKMKGRNNPVFKNINKCKCGKGCYYDSPLQGKIWLRSSYEIAYVKYLDENKILWLYENYTFDLGNTTYTPDFFLPQFNKMIEIKGYMSQEAQDKINKFLIKYPCNFQILYKKDLIKLGVLK